VVPQPILNGPKKIGADAYAKNMVEAVKVAEQLMKDLTKKS